MLSTNPIKPATVLCLRLNKNRGVWLGANQNAKVLVSSGAKCRKQVRWVALCHRLDKNQTSQSKAVFATVTLLPLHWNQILGLDSSISTKNPSTWGSPIGFFNPAILTRIFFQSRNPDGFYRLIPIPVLTSAKTILEVPFQISSQQTQQTQALTIRFN